MDQALGHNSVAETSCRSQNLLLLFPGKSALPAAQARNLRVTLIPTLTKPTGSTLIYLHSESSCSSPPPATPGPGASSWVSLHPPLPKHQLSTQLHPPKMTLFKSDPNTAILNPLSGVSRDLLPPHPTTSLWSPLSSFHSTPSLLALIQHITHTATYTIHLRAFAPAIPSGWNAIPRRVPPWPFSGHFIKKGFPGLLALPCPPFPLFPPTTVTA